MMAEPRNILAKAVVGTILVVSLFLLAWQAYATVIPSGAPSPWEWFKRTASDDAGVPR